MEHLNIILSLGLAGAKYQSQIQEWYFVTTAADHVSWGGIHA